MLTWLLLRAPICLELKALSRSVVMLDRSAVSIEDACASVIADNWVVVSAATCAVFRPAS